MTVDSGRLSIELVLWETPVTVPSSFR